MHLFVYYSAISLFIASNGLPTRFNKLGASSGHISYTVPYLFYSNFVLFLLKSLLHFLFRIEDPMAQPLLYNRLDTFNRIKIRALSRMDKVLNIMGLLILLCKALFFYTVGWVTILLKKPRFIIDKPSKFNSFDIDRQKAVNIVFLGYSIALNLKFDIVRLIYLPFLYLAVIFLLSFSFWTLLRLYKIRRVLNLIFFVIIKLQFLCFPPLKDPRGNIILNTFKWRPFFNIFQIILLFLLPKDHALCL